jgi:hypothetical protein
MVEDKKRKKSRKKPGRNVGLPMCSFLLSIDFFDYGRFGNDHMGLVNPFGAGIVIILMHLPVGYWKILASVSVMGDSVGLAAGNADFPVGSSGNGRFFPDNYLVGCARRNQRGNGKELNQM